MRSRAGEQGSRGVPDPADRAADGIFTPNRTPNHTPSHTPSHAPSDTPSGQLAGTGRTGRTRAPALLARALYLAAKGRDLAGSEALALADHIAELRCEASALRGAVEGVAREVTADSGLDFANRLVQVNRRAHAALDVPRVEQVPAKLGLSPEELT